MKKKAKKITFKKIHMYLILGLFSVNVSENNNEVELNGIIYNINDLGAGVLRWLSNYSRANRIHSDSIYTMLLKNKKYYLPNKKRLQQ